MTRARAASRRAPRKKPADPPAPRERVGSPAAAPLRLSAPPPPIDDARRGALQREVLAVDTEKMGGRVPWSVLMRESLDVARVALSHWEPARDPQGAPLLPGLASLGASHLTRSDVQDILHLRAMAESHQLDAVMSATRTPRGPENTRADAVLAEVREVLTYFLGDADPRLDVIRRLVGAAPSSLDDTAEALHQYAALGQSLRAQLDGFGGFSVATLDEAATLSRRLRARPPRSEVVGPSAEAMAMRDRVACVLQQRMQKVRAAGRFVFRNHPEVAQMYQSAYERQRRTARKRARAGA